MTDSTDRRQAVILAGGAGTRLASRLNGLPKPLVDVDGSPLLERQLRQLAAAGFREAVILVSHRREAIEAFCATMDIPDFTIHVRDDGAKARGTAGATYGARDILAARFLVVYGDTLFDIDLARFWAAHEIAREQGCDATLFLHPNDHPFDSDLVEIDADGVVRAFHPKPHAPGEWLPNLVNAALYVVEKSLITDFPAEDGVVDFGRDLFPKVVAAGRRLKGYITYEYIKDLGTPERLERVTADLRSGKVARARLSNPQKAVFLDRDGTLNVMAGHIARPEALALADGAAEAVRAFNRAEYRCVLITNQPVIARGECTLEELSRIHAKLETKLGESGGFLDAIYYCPHHPDSGFAGEVPDLKMICNCRKPAPGLLLQAAKDLSVDLAASWVVGDSAADVGAARRAGVRSILLRTSGARGIGMTEQPDYEVQDIGEARALILGGAQAVREALAPWVERIRPGMMVRIAGRSCVGKSTAAATLSELLVERGIAALHLQLDRWTIPRPVPLADGGAPDADALALFDATIATWRAGEALDIVTPRYDPIRRVSDPLGWRAQLPANGVLIVDGALGFMVDPGGREVFSLFMTAAEDHRRSRFMREAAARGLPESGAIDLYRSDLSDHIPRVDMQRDEADGEIEIPSFERQLS
ncbi:HAD-IIIA family hydrolase [Bosea sp. ASV33]|uniref:HAD-IIIA family hydrolase n=1 Tax=Bosea sp. ASV33 TaxID=2795106 RepID=UPI0018EA98A8|nr:HAD-IIIA family hydrolase [Bosea sp. ASV33]